MAKERSPDPCEFCGRAIPPSLSQCPHCGRPGNFPNVRRFQSSEFAAALDRRASDARAAAEACGTGEQLERLETLARRTTAVLNRSVEQTVTLCKTDEAAYAPFYRLLDAGAILPNDDDWSRLRILADAELFGMGMLDIRFAALSPNGSGLPHYGGAIWELDEASIAHRATVFEENSAVFFQRARTAGQEPPVLEGYCALWSERFKLAVAKHARELAVDMVGDALERILLRPDGSSGADDVFIEVHIYGSLTRYSLRQISICEEDIAKSQLVDLRKRLAGTGVELKVTQP